MGLLPVLFSISFGSSLAVSSLKLLLIKGVRFYHELCS